MLWLRPKGRIHFMIAYGAPRTRLQAPYANSADVTVHSAVHVHVCSAVYMYMYMLHGIVQYHVYSS